MSKTDWDSAEADAAKLPGWVRLMPALTGVAMLGGMLALPLLAGPVLGIDREGGFDAILADVQNTPWAPFAVIGLFIALGLTGFPQFLMIGGAVVALGPWAGIVCAWTGTMLSATVGFFLGHFFGGRLLRRYGGRRVNGMSQKIAKHGILASALVRNLPAGPFIMVNMVAGMSHMPIRKYWIGTGLGILPKTLLIAFLGQGLMSFVKTRSAEDLVLIAVGLAAWIGLIVLVRWAMKRSAVLQEVSFAKAEDELADSMEPATETGSRAEPAPAAAEAAPPGTPGTHRA